MVNYENFEIFLHTACCFGYYHGISLVYCMIVAVDTQVGVAWLIDFYKRVW